MNKIVDEVIKISELEKKTPITEVFYRYSKDKDTMYDTIKTIYTKQSDFINLIDGEKQILEKRVQTNKLKNSPFFINTLFGYNSKNIFSIDNKGDDWYSIITALSQLVPDEMHALKQINISLKFAKNLSKKILPDIHKLIINGLNKIGHEELDHFSIAELQKEAISIGVNEDIVNSIADKEDSKDNLIKIIHDTYIINIISEYNKYNTIRYGKDFIRFK